MRKLLSSSGFLLLLISFISASIIVFASRAGGQEEEKTPPAANTAENSFVGDETCSSCHADVMEGFQKTVHGGKAFDMRSDKGCESCHGPGQAHVDAGGDKSLIVSFKTLRASESSETCLQCHEKGEQTHWMGSTHQKRELGCLDCHSVHYPKSDKSQLKTVKADDTCATCHSQIRALTMRTSHHPIREGLMTCSDCHNPHGTETPRMIKAASVNEQCYTCHTEKRGPFLWEHPPVRENCLSCHNAHGSNHPKLLVSKRPYLCQTCHLDTRHPGTLYDASNLNTSNREFARSCSNCHLTVHGSNHPSGWTFTR